VVRGLIEPTWTYLSPAEMETCVNGRYRGDGRRLDQFVSDDPLLIELSDPTLDVDQSIE
jgi:hypothetical protein